MWLTLHVYIYAYKCKGKVIHELMDILKGKVTPFRQAIHRWRARRDVPFRSKFFVGYDLEGNTYWELKNHNNPGRMRRIIEPRDTSLSLCDYKLAPQWMQWLRFARPTSPTLDELIGDQMRQARLKGLVAAADQRWKEIPLKEPESSQEHTIEPSQDSKQQQQQQQEVRGRTPAQPIVGQRH